MEHSNRQSVFRDYAGDDPRSVKAWLEGRDDGRGRLYEAFREEFLRQDPAAPEDEIGSHYRRALQRGWRYRPYRRLMWIGFGCTLYASLLLGYWINH